LTQPEEIFLCSEEKKIENLTPLGEIFQTQTLSIDGWPDPTRVKIFYPDPSLALTTELKADWFYI